jgi:adenylate kinase family enzyme
VHRIVIFGNSGAGKSTLAMEQALLRSCPHLDLDTVAWEESCDVPTRRPLTDSETRLKPFLSGNESWVVEGCYSDLLNLVIPYCTEIIFLNPGVDVCIANCRSRPWELHKYDSQEEQNENLDMLLEWVGQYALRNDEFSLRAHRKIFDDYRGQKREYTSNARPEHEA